MHIKAIVSLLLFAMCTQLTIAERSGDDEQHPSMQMRFEDLQLKLKLQASPLLQKARPSRTATSHLSIRADPCSSSSSSIPSIPIFRRRSSSSSSSSLRSFSSSSLLFRRCTGNSGTDSDGEWEAKKRAKAVSKALKNLSNGPQLDVWPRRERRRSTSGVLRKLARYVKFWRREDVLVSVESSIVA
ncbi:hypothetical protein IE81DRAFT_326720 [Ceraceosorus guamensis]|uniref:Uncharacterized protein n=1 Tax=Ceraceosorus guamensis TaxID=1522189 RepID=A0A316VP05_9BASI|nr:hypothetical protein IE81DRAFT_326720 [Ceraceosorus guamensis]PWN39262.1 hypothetical protein IE81DRAFT_326720 [Ceraceosorus guamensis]